jgi:hypothetical protein
MNGNDYEEGDDCPECARGVLEYPKIRGCSCHINPPCSACVDQRLVCDSCGWEEPEPERRIPSDSEVESYRKWMQDVEEARTRGHILPGGGRIFNVDYDSSSGSTMVFTGRYEGDVTAKEIFEHIGDGSFGHRGPTLWNGRFSYTKITD